jgi:deoxyribonuclease-1
MKSLIVSLFVLLCVVPHVFADAPEGFSAAKAVAKRHIFFDEFALEQGDLYCGCRWDWVGRSGGAN